MIYCFGCQSVFRMKKASLYKLAIACMNFDILYMHYTIHTYQWFSAVSMHYTVMETPCVLYNWKCQGHAIWRTYRKLYLIGCPIMHQEMYRKHEPFIVQEMWSELYIFCTNTVSGNVDILPVCSPLTFIHSWAHRPISIVSAHISLIVTSIYL